MGAIQGGQSHFTSSIVNRNGWIYCDGNPGREGTSWETHIFANEQNIMAKHSQHKICNALFEVAEINNNDDHKNIASEQMGNNDNKHGKKGMAVWRSKRIRHVFTHVPGNEEGTIMGAMASWCDACNDHIETLESRIIHKQKKAGLHGKDKIKIHHCRKSCLLRMTKSDVEMFGHKKWTEKDAKKALEEC